MMTIGIMALAFALAAAETTGPVPTGPGAGDQAPGFSMTGSDGKTYTLADFKGKEAVVIAWFPKAFTGG